MEPKDEVSKARFKLLREYPFYGEVMLELKFVYTDQVPIMACTNQELFINLSNLKDFSYEEVLFSLAHEIKHVCLFHPYIQKTFLDKDKFLLNIAEDVLVNELVKEEFSPSSKLQENLIWAKKFEELRDKNVKKMTSLEIYEILADKFKKVMKQFPSLEVGDPKDFQKDFKQFSKKLDDLENKGEISPTEKNIFKQAYVDYYFKRAFDKLGKEEKEKISKRIKEAMMRGYVKQKERGTLTVGEEALIEHSFKKVRDWKQLLRENIIKTVKGD